MELLMEAIRRCGLRSGARRRHRDRSGDVRALTRTVTMSCAGGDHARLRRPRRIRWESWVDKYPIVSLEDGWPEDDWDGWKLLTDRLGGSGAAGGGRQLRHQQRAFATGNRRRHRELDPHQAQPDRYGDPRRSRTIALATAHNYSSVISHRSGETEDTSIADLAVAVNAGQIKTGAPSRSERVAKYNRLLRIEHELGDARTVRRDRAILPDRPPSRPEP